MARTVRELVLEYYKAHPNEELEHDPVVDWVSAQYNKEHGKPPRDPWRMIRTLHEEKILIQVSKGVYMYDPDFIHEPDLDDFDTKTKLAILERDGYRCVVCGRGEEDGVELAVDHMCPKDKGGSNDISNGQTLCVEHNNLKKNYSRTEAGKRYFIQLFEQAKTKGDRRVIKFCEAVFAVYDKHGMNGHIPVPEDD